MAVQCCAVLYCALLCWAQTERALSAGRPLHMADPLVQSTCLREVVDGLASAAWDRSKELPRRSQITQNIQIWKPPTTSNPPDRTHIGISCSQGEEAPQNSGVGLGVAGQFRSGLRNGPSMRHRFLSWDQNGCKTFSPNALADDSHQQTCLWSACEPRTGFLPLGYGPLRGGAGGPFILNPCPAMFPGGQKLSQLREVCYLAAHHPTNTGFASPKPHTHARYDTLPDIFAWRAGGMTNWCCDSDDDPGFNCGPQQDSHQAHLGRGSRRRAKWGGYSHWM